MSNKKSTSLQQKAEGKKQALKNSLFQPYIIKWPLLEKGENHSILEDLSRFFDQHPEIKKVRSLGKRKSTGKLDSKTPLLRQYIVTGINGVTKALEKRRLNLVLVCRSATPVFITQHIISLTATRNVPSAAVAGLSAALSQKLNFKSVLAIGFKLPTDSDRSELLDLVDLIKNIPSKITPITLPWLTPTHKKDTVTQSLPEKENQLIPTQICLNKYIANKKQKKK